MAKKTPPQDTYVRNVTIVSWTDGDTAKLLIDLGFDTLHKATLRLHGCNAPESRSRSASEKARGLAAKAQAALLAPPGTQVTLKSYKSGNEKYGRYLAEIYLPDGREVGAELVKGGFALPWDGKGKPPI